MDNGTIDNIGLEALCSPHALNYLFEEADRLQEKMSLLLYGTVSETPAYVLGAALLDEVQKVKVTNLERFVFKKSALHEFQELLQEKGTRFLETQSHEAIDDIHALFRDYFFNGYRKPITDCVYKARREDGSYFYSCWVDDEDSEVIFVSQGIPNNWYVNVDLWLRDEDEANELVSRYIDSIERVQEKVPVDAVCLLKKYAGCKGLMQVYNKVVDRVAALGKSVICYSQLTGEVFPLGNTNLPHDRANICVFGDVALTGRSVKRTKTGIEDNYSSWGWRVPSAILLKNFTGTFLDGHEIEQLPPVIEEVVTDYLFATPQSMMANRGQRLAKQPPLYPKEEATGSEIIPDFDLSCPRCRHIVEGHFKEIQWWNENEKRLLSEHAGRWIGAAGDSLYVGDSEQQVMEDARNEGAILSRIVYADPEGYVEI